MKSLLIVFGASLIGTIFPFLAFGGYIFVRNILSDGAFGENTGPLSYELVVPYMFAMGFLSFVLAIVYVRKR